MLGSGSIRPPFLPPVWPVPSPALVTSVHGHQYLQGTGKDWEGVGCPLCAQSCGTAITELVPRCARGPVSCCPLQPLSSPECEALGVASPGSTGSSFLPCPLPTPKLVSAAGTELSTSLGPKPHSVPVSKSQRARPAPNPEGSLDQPLASATSLAFPSTLRVGLFAGSCGGSSRVPPGAVFSVLSI